MDNQRLCKECGMPMQEETETKGLWKCKNGHGIWVYEVEMSPRLSPMPLHLLSPMPIRALRIQNIEFNEDDE